MKHWFIERSPRLGEKAIQTKLHYIKGAIKLICRTSVVQQSAVSPHQGYRQLLEGYRQLPKSVYKLGTIEVYKIQGKNIIKDESSTVGNLLVMF